MLSAGGRCWHSPLSQGERGFAPLQREVLLAWRREPVDRVVSRPALRRGFASKRPQVFAPREAGFVVHCAGQIPHYVPDTLRPSPGAT